MLYSTNVNDDIKKIAEYCNRNNVGILRINVPEQTFIVEQSNGTPSVCDFKEVPRLNYDRPTDLSRDGLLELVSDYNEYIQEKQKEYPGVDLLTVSDYLRYEDEIVYDKLQVVKFDESDSDELCEAAADIYTSAAAQIMDVFENILDEHNISLPSTDRTGCPGEARIFGETYYNIESQVEDILHECVSELVKSDLIKVVTINE